MINGGATTVQDERGPGLDFYFVFHVRQSSARGCRFSFVFVYFIIKVFECSPAPRRRRRREPANIQTIIHFESKVILSVE